MEQEIRERITAQNLLEEVRLAMKDVFVASIRKHSDELSLIFPNGQRFTLTLWENVTAEKPAEK